MKRIIVHFLNIGSMGNRKTLHNYVEQQLKWLVIHFRLLTILKWSTLNWFRCHE